MGLGDIADGIARQIEAVGDGVNEALFEPVVRLGVTGSVAAGKTVFITSLVRNLMIGGRLPLFMPAAEGRVRRLLPAAATGRRRPTVRL